MGMSSILKQKSGHLHAITPRGTAAPVSTQLVFVIMAGTTETGKKFPDANVKMVMLHWKWTLCLIDLLPRHQLSQRSH